MAQATVECPQNPIRKLLILLRTNGDVQLDQVALSWLESSFETIGNPADLPRPAIQGVCCILRSQIIALRMGSVPPVAVRKKGDLEMLLMGAESMKGAETQFQKVREMVVGKQHAPSASRLPVVDTFRTLVFAPATLELRA